MALAKQRGHVIPASENSIADLKKYLSDSEKPISMEEFKEFWATCTEAEKQEFKQTKLK